VLAQASPAAAAPRLASFTCAIGDGRKRVLPRKEEADRADDELQCRATLAGLRGRSGTELVAELRILTPTGPPRVVATAAFARSQDVPGRAVLDELVVPHATWTAAVDWGASPRPIVRLALNVYAREPATRRPRWRLLLSGTLDLGSR
jgi:hypothetical protein